MTTVCLLTQNLQLNGFINAPLKSLIRALAGDFHAVHVLGDIQLHLSRRDLAAPQTRLIRDATVAHQGNSIFVPAQPHWRIAGARIAEETRLGSYGQRFRFHTYLQSFRHNCGARCKKKEKFLSVGEKHHHNDDNGRAGAHNTNTKKFFFCFAPKKERHKKAGDRAE